MQQKDLNVIFSHKTDSWATPPWLFAKLNREFKFTLDPAADDHNAKCAKYYTQEQDGLQQDWAGETVFINPPYSKIYDWVKKTASEVLSNKITAVMLLPVRSDTRWFHEFCLDGNLVKEIRFVKGRLKFGEGKNSAPFPSMIVVFEEGKQVLPIVSSTPNKS